MSEIDERLQRAMNDLAGVQLIDNTWQEAEVVRREITGIIQTLHRDLCAANADLREWEGLRFQIDQCKKSRERLKARAEAAEAEATALKKLEAAHRGEEARQAADLHERLATAEDETTRLCKELTIASSLVPSADWLLMVAAIADDLGCDACPYLGNCENHCDRISDKARARAARIRAWRGDGDKEEESDGD